MLRRDFLVGAGAAAIGCARGPSIRTRRPHVTHGVQAGDVQDGRALVWARCDEPARLVIEWSADARFSRAHRVAGPVVDPRGDHAATVAIDGLPDGQTISYRVRFEREAERGESEWVGGRFATPTAEPFRFAWTGDTCGQGFGRNPEWGGLRGYAAIAAARPRFFVHSGDLVYADNPIVAEQRTWDGRVWRNVTNERVARVAEELDDFRARFAYNLEDEHVRALAADVPIVAQWDDHETHNNWWPGQTLDDARYTRERDATTLSRYARRAMLEWTPTPPGPVHRVVKYGPLLDIVVLDCRSFRTPNDGGAGASMLGAAQVDWAIAALSASRARWRVVACDQPIGVQIPDGPHDERLEGFGDGTDRTVGRERELARLLSAIASRGVRDTIWITADVHYAAAHRYDPARAAIVRDERAAFEPFWEFVAGPIHAGTFGPNKLDPTFGPEVAFQWAPPAGATNLAPWDGLQSFGTVDVSRDALVVTLWGIDGKPRHRVEIVA